MNSFASHAVLLAGVFGLCGDDARAASRPETPANFIFILTDDMTSATSCSASRVRVARRCFGNGGSP